MRRLFKKLNVVKITESDEKANTLLAQGFQEITEARVPIKKPRTPKGSREKESEAEQSEGENDGEPKETETSAGH